MTIQELINGIKSNISNAYDELSKKGATIPSSATSANLKSTVASIKVATVIYDESTDTLKITTT